MNILQAISGIALLALLFADMTQTVLGVHSHRQLSRRLSTLIWRLLNGIHKRRHSQRLLALAGPLIILVYFIVWFAMLWAGWSLIFASGEDNVVHGATGEPPPDLSSFLGFVGVSVVTLGGEYVPRGSLWQMLTVVVSLNGFLMVTLMISYLVSVITAVLNARAFASQVGGLGRKPTYFVLAGWDGESLRSLDAPLSHLNDRLAIMSEHYVAYEVIRYYHAHSMLQSAAWGVVLLDEALTLLRFGIEPAARPSVAVLHSLRATVQTFIDRLPSEDVQPAIDVPPAPNLGPLREAGIPLTDEAEFRAALKVLSDRRRRLLGLIRSDGRDWRDLE